MSFRLLPVILLLSIWTVSCTVPEASVQRENLISQRQEAIENAKKYDLSEKPETYLIYSLGGDFVPCPVFDIDFRNFRTNAYNVNFSSSEDVQLLSPERMGEDGIMGRTKIIAIQKNPESVDKVCAVEVTIEHFFQGNTEE